MEIRCENCNSTLKIPDEKVPANQTMNILCPKCKKTCSVHPKTAAPKSNTKVPTVEMTMGELTDFLAKGEKRALICDDDHSNHDVLRSALKDLGYSPSIGTDPNEVIGKIKFNHYDLILLNEMFGGNPPPKNSVLSYLQPMPIATRRTIFFGLVGRQYKTLDNRAAFAQSVNVVINEKDLPNIKTILKRSISDNDNFYTHFKEALISSGKK